ncbi:MAG: hypothetical protein H6P94_675 [Thermoplasmatales archaeon]|jgi:hypothetical protein|nr:hypothetical protein [Thermoplasmatales archaeon]
MIRKKTIGKEFCILLIVSSLVLSSFIGTGNILAKSDGKDGNIPAFMEPQEFFGQSNPHNKAVLFSEGFEWGFPPTGWTQIITNSGYCDSYPQYSAFWNQFSENVHNGSRSAYVWWDYQHQDEWLITPEINLVDIPNGKLTFWSYAYEGSIHDDHYYVKISTDNGTTWTELFDLSSFPPNQGWNSYTSPYLIDLSDYHGQMIKLAWHAVSTLDDGLWYQWCIDDVLITGGDITPPVTTCTITGVYNATITFTATDDMSAVAYTKYKLNNGAWTEYTVPIVVTAIGDHIVYYYSVDTAGNVEGEKSKTFTIQLPITIAIQGGVGVTAIIKNVGSIELTNIYWSMQLDGKLIFAGKTKSGTIVNLNPGEEFIVKNSVLGFGKTNIAVSAGTIDAVVSGRVFLFFVWGVK